MAKHIVRSVALLAFVIPAENAAMDAKNTMSRRRGTNWTTTPHPTPSCSVVKQEGNASCEIGNTFGCEKKDRDWDWHMWTSGGCAGKFMCHGVEVGCKSNPYNVSVKNKCWCTSPSQRRRSTRRSSLEDDDSDGYEEEFDDENAAMDAKNTMSRRRGTNWTTTPHPTPSCHVVKQKGNASCEIGNTFGCEKKDRDWDWHMWTSGGCHGKFMCHGVEVRCKKPKNPDRKHKCMCTSSSQRRRSSRHSSLEDGDSDGYEKFDDEEFDLVV